MEFHPGQELPETCRVSCQNKFVKLVHLVGFIINKNILCNVFISSYFRLLLLHALLLSHFRCVEEKQLEYEILYKTCKPHTVCLKYYFSSASCHFGTFEMEN